MFKKLTLISTLILSTLTINTAQAEIASYYGGYFHGRKAADGSVFNQNAMTTAASSRYRLGDRLHVTNTKTGKSVVVKVTDRGGFAKYGRTLDLSRGAFSRIAPLGQGTCHVKIKKLK